MAERLARAQLVNATRGQIMDAAERLFAVHGVATVSNRQVSEAAGQGNNTAVGYHFGTKTDLIRAAMYRHTQQIEQLRLQKLTEGENPVDVHGWVSYLVRPVTEHLATLGVPSWYARFSAQVAADPTLRDIMVETSRASPSLQEMLEGLNRCLPDMPPEVHAERVDMTSQLMIHMCAERERALANDTLTPRDNWRGTATGLIDAITGMWLAPVTPTRGTGL